MYVDCADVGDVLVSPDVVEELLAAEDLAGVAHQVGEQVELFGLHRHLLPLARHAPLRWIERQIADGQRWWRRVVRLLVVHPAAPQHRLDAGE